uniref:Uncharacterized protein n=1 Tax=Vibrio tasmaniensis TaxID=212663 RepID=A0A0H3ZZY6_9VIBR|nr:hypothetical protein [Vibrio tasmaniensis]
MRHPQTKPWLECGDYQIGFIRKQSHITTPPSNTTDASEPLKQLLIGQSITIPALNQMLLMWEQDRMIGCQLLLMWEQDRMIGCQLLLMWEQDRMIGCQLLLMWEQDRMIGCQLLLMWEQCQQKTHLKYNLKMLDQLISTR